MVAVGEKSFFGEKSDVLFYIFSAVFFSAAHFIRRTAAVRGQKSSAHSQPHSDFVIFGGKFKFRLHYLQGLFAAAPFTSCESNQCRLTGSVGVINLSAAASVRLLWMLH